MTAARQFFDAETLHPVADPPAMTDAVRENEISHSHYSIRVHTP